MSNSLITYDPIMQSQASKEVTVNQYLDAASPATSFGRRGSTCSGLSWGMYGGTINIDGVITQISNAVVMLTASAINYLEISRAGVVTVNIAGFTAGRIPLYLINTGTSTVSSYYDYRTWVALPGVSGKAAIALTTSNVVLTAAQARCHILECTGAIPSVLNVIVPLSVQQWTVFNGTTGGFGVQFVGATGVGVVVAMGRRAIIYADGTGVMRVTADA